MVADASKFVNARQVFLFRLGVLPQYHPKTGTSHDGDVGLGHAVAFYDVPLMGPNRIGTVGEQMTFDGHVSYALVGGEATGHSWRVYQSSSETIGSGSLVHSHSGVTMDWTPGTDGIFRVELRTNHRMGDGSTDAARFVRVFPDYRNSDWTKSIEISGSFSLDSGGHELTIRYKPLDPGETTEFHDWSRIVIQIRSFYAYGPPGMSDEYNYQSDQAVSTGNPPSADVFFNGILLENSIAEDANSETITFKVVSPSYILQKIPLPGYAAVVVATTETGSMSLPVEYPLIFGDPTRDIVLPDATTINVIQSIKEGDPNFPAHEIAAMHFTDPIYHVLQRHTNFMQWFDVYLEQTAELHQFPYAMSQGSIWQQLRKFQDSRLGVLYSNRKGVLYFSRDIRFQDDAWWGDNIPDVVMSFSRDNIGDAQVHHNPFRVAQVQLSGVNDQEQPFFSRFPALPDTIGEIIKRTGLIAFDQGTMDVWAGRMYSIMNQPDDLTVTALGINRSLDIQDVVGVDYTDRAGVRTV